jgi:peptidyl-prolyl cis-trans isomerase B (cyclophilin B)
MQTEAPKAGDLVVNLHTSEGDVKIKLFPKEIPEGVKNFTELAKAGKYDGAPFHRIIAGFMVQGGDFTNHNGTGGHSYKGEGTTIGDEYHPELTHIRGALSYAKTAAPNSIGSQFFIVHQPSNFLDHPEGGGPAEGYTVFGQVYEGLDVVDKMAGVATNRNDAPHEPILITGVDVSDFE